MQPYWISLQASIMIVVIVLIRALGVHKLPKFGLQALWGAALVRLLYPFRIQFRLSVYNLVQWFEEMAAKPSTSTAAPVLVQASSGLVSPPTEMGMVAASPSVSLTLWPILWLVPAFLLLAYFVLTHLRWRRVYAKAISLTYRRVSALPWSRTICVKTSAIIEAPLTYGVLRPVVLLPQAMAKGQVLDCVLAHEIAHIRHWDALTKGLLTLALCVHWFNPLVWAMYVLANRDLELCCDAAVLRDLGADQRARYASMLVEMEEARSALTPLVSHFSKNAIEERIIGIMKYRKTTLSGMLITLALVLLTTGALATDAIPQPGSGPTTGTAASSTMPVDPYAEAMRFAPYVRFGLSYDMINDQLYYNGTKVRYFEDFYTTGSNGVSTGLCRTDETGTIDVHAVRDLSKRVYRADGSFDPSLELTGVIPYTQSEYDARTDVSQTLPSAGISYDLHNADDIQWWTAEEYAQWLDQQRKELPQYIGERAWNQTDGWFVWTQEKIDETLHLYEQILVEIKAGILHSKFVNGKTDISISGTVAPATSSSESMDIVAENAPNLSVQFSGSTAPIAEDVVISSTVKASSGTEAFPSDIALVNGTALMFSSAEPAGAEITLIEKENGHEGAQLLTATFQTPDGRTVNLGSFPTYLDRYNAVKAYCDGLVAKGAMTQAQADALCARYR